ncbi:hypothetical protein [Calycomorphotria hydatis]|uniref:Uncharacterized protein n=1 Tax=Calycomorphotria hydatis TaxID=2528027 RepID=A0A517T8I6_9PLAN|nr:hypothetical protein [Calycomorphotria hydatis]QDT64702.1 hypothetical protein V22_19430 [Calycomorphotria hydatis]
MIKWNDISDKHSRFFEGNDENHTSNNYTEALEALLGFLKSDILGKGNSQYVDLFFLKINTDSGRLIACATTKEKYSAGVADGCCIRCQAVQNYWYNLDDSGVADDVFEIKITEHSKEIGAHFKKMLNENVDEIFAKCSVGDATYWIIGIEPNDIIVDEKLFDEND